MIKTFEINNQLGDRVVLMDLGARLISWQTELEQGSRDIIVHYPNLQDYYDDDCYLGAIAGPYANRIRNAKVATDKHSLKLHSNDSQHHLHGGKNALDACVWQVKQHSERAITFTYWLEDGFNGYPGAMTFEIEYRLAEQTSQLKINFNVVTDKATLIGPTGHGYFNLAGDQGSINQHQLEIYAQYRSNLDKDKLPEPENLELIGSPYDFSQAKCIGSLALDDNFIITNDTNCHAKLISPCGKLAMQVESDYPAVQVYSGDHLLPPLQPRAGICIEPHFGPDAPNDATSGFHWTEPGQVFNKKILYKLEKSS